MTGRPEHHHKEWEPNLLHSCTDIALGVNTTQARWQMPSPPKMPRVRVSPSNAQQLWIIPAPSLHRQEGETFETIFPKSAVKVENEYE